MESAPSSGNSSSVNSTNQVGSTAAATGAGSGAAGVVIRRSASQGGNLRGGGPESALSLSPTSTSGSRSTSRGRSSAIGRGSRSSPTGSGGGGGGGNPAGGSTGGGGSGHRQSQSQLRKATASAAPASVSSAATPSQGSGSVKAHSSGGGSSSGSGSGRSLLVRQSSSPVQASTSGSSSQQPHPSGSSQRHALGASVRSPPRALAGHASHHHGHGHHHRSATPPHQHALRHIGGAGTAASAAMSLRSVTSPRTPATASTTGSSRGGAPSVAGSAAMAGTPGGGGGGGPSAENPFAPSFSAETTAPAPAAAAAPAATSAGAAAETYRPAATYASQRNISTSSSSSGTGTTGLAASIAGRSASASAVSPSSLALGNSTSSSVSALASPLSHTTAAQNQYHPSQPPQPRPRGWVTVPCHGGVPPCQRSLHASAVLHSSLYVFGGYDGQSRINDFHSYSFLDRRWSPVLPSAGSGPPPSPRDRHVAVVWGDGFYVFGGFDGTSRVNDFYGFELSSMTWNKVTARGGTGGTGGGGNNAAASTPPPSPRHSHSAVVWEDSMFVFGGYDGSYRSDFHEYNFLSRTWSSVPSAGRTPRARYRATCVVHRNTMILFGGHDGTRHLSDTHLYDFASLCWSTVSTEGTPPIPRDSHVAVVHRDSMYVFGGSTGSAMNDLHELRLCPPTTNSASASSASAATIPASSVGGAGHAAAPATVARWRPIDTSAAAASSSGNGSDNGNGGGGAVQAQAGHRFCHVAATYGDSVYIFGGYDGSARLNDFLRYDFDVDDLTCDVPPSTLVRDLRGFLGASDDGSVSANGAGGEFDELADVTFLVENIPVKAHKILLTRCPYFRAMFLGPMMESSSSAPIVLEDVRHPIFLLLLEYLYTDELSAFPLDAAMELFVAADRFDVPRLRSICERRMLGSMTVDNVATVFHAADLHSAQSLRAKALKFVLNHFETVSKTSAFEEMARSNVELVFEILRSR